MPTDIATETRFRARSAGPAFPEGPCRLAVHSVFKKALNLRVEGGDLLVALTGPAGSGLPWALVLAEEVDFLSWDLLPGDPCRLEGGALTLGTEGVGTRVDLGAAMRSPLPRMPRIGRLGVAHRAAKTELERIQAAKGSELRYRYLTDPERPASLAATAIARGASELRSGKGSDLRKALALIVGTGPGLTPSGDDFLGGFLAALAGLKAEAPRSRGRSALLRLESLPSLVEEFSARTGEISASMLRAAARGLFDAAIVELAKAVAADDSPAAVLALRSLCARGHSSGADTATGFLFALECFAASRETPTAASDSRQARRRQHAS